MRVSELLDREVVRDDGSVVGRIHDVRLVQDAPGPAGGDAMFRVDAVIVGTAGLATRLGYSRNGITGPWLIRSVATMFEKRRTTQVPWADIARRNDQLVQILR